jgi:2-dehydro-3-deoxy-D-arabinonate dehydratase
MKRDDVIRLCRFRHARSGERPRIGLVLDDDRIAELADADAPTLTSLLESDDPAGAARAALQRASMVQPLAEVVLLPPVERQEVWAAGVTYLRSKTARMEESDFSATAYDRVYEAPRPEIFFKAVGEKVVGPGDMVGIRRDATWSVPEPELALVMNSRDIEGENLLYLPQAKTYDRSCSLGPWITLVDDEHVIRQWSISVSISRSDKVVFAGETGIDKIKRPFGDLMAYLWRSQAFARGVVLLTGTGVVPDDSFTLAPDDHITIIISGIGRLENAVTLV